MIIALSYIFAVLITIALAIVLYPIAGVFWILGFFGKISEALFSFTSRVINSLWRDIGSMNKPNANEIVKDSVPLIVDEVTGAWECSCGTTNHGKFCVKCGHQK